MMIVPFGCLFRRRRPGPARVSHRPDGRIPAVRSLPLPWKLSVISGSAITLSILRPMRSGTIIFSDLSPLLVIIRMPTSSRLDHRNHADRHADRHATKRSASFQKKAVRLILPFLRKPVRVQVCACAMRARRSCALNGSGFMLCRLHYAAAR